MNEYAAVVYDLDGTLVHLDVDWDEVREATSRELRAREIESDGENLWDMFTRGREEGFEPIVEETISEFEYAGARTSTRLAGADELPLEVPVGVCSLNSERAVRTALEVHGLDEYVEAVVGRDSVSNHKPDPEPLLSTVRSLSALPEQTLFIGDSERDEQTAKRAGVEFQYVSDRYK